LSRARYIVGIDLGTTNSAIAYVDTAEAKRRIAPLPIPQLVAESTVAERPALPSFLYVGGEHDVAPGALALPWDPHRTYAVGEFARAQGARVPGRLVTSAKSWLCHGGVDREAPILPWAAPDDVAKLSPVEASSRYLQHVREAWQQRFPGAPLEEQQIVLTVPASFDEVARELSVAAAERAGLPHTILLEEPQAAFYAWIDENEGRWQDLLRETRLVFVVDIGGGTSDFSLIRVGRDGDRLTLDRLAVGDHILLGGDNIDVALARRLEPRLGERLDSQRWHALTSLCRSAKEVLLSDGSPDEVPIRLAGRGRAVVGGVLTGSLARREVEELVMNGFFPLTPPDAAPRKSARAGLQEWGLPFASEAEVSRHLAAFVRQHAGDRAAAGDQPLGRPDAVLFNGGALKPAIVRDRLRDLLASWGGGTAPDVLHSTDLDLAVARGAAYYGLVRRGLGVRIGGGSPRAYYLGLAAPGAGAADAIRALCIVHRGMHEGDEVEVTSPAFDVLANQPVSFPLYASSTRLGDASGAVVEAARESLAELPPIRTVLRFGKKLAARAIPVHVISRLTEIGTLEVWCRSLVTDHRWRLQFSLRDAVHETAEEEREEGGGASELEVAPERLEAAARALRAVFPAAAAPGGGDPVGLMRELESAMDAGRDAWPLGAIRRLWDVLWEGRAARGVTQQHEARWLNLCGFLLRPGFGHELDEWRIQQLWKLYTEGLRFPRAVQCRAEWWSMWKRIAGGLSRAQQQELYNQVAPFVLPRLKAKTKGKRSAVGPQEVREYWQLLASCERLSAAAKAELGSALLPSVAKGKAADAEVWALGRLGARAPFHGPLNCVVARQNAEEWVEGLLRRDWRKPGPIGFAAVQLARYVGDRERDLDEGLRRRLAERLRQQPRGERAARLVTEYVPLEAQERARLLDESLPVGLQIRDSDAAQTVDRRP
jgi:molecular chaperone DnaK (HSP70)